MYLEIKFCSVSSSVEQCCDCCLQSVYCSERYIVVNITLQNGKSRVLVLCSDLLIVLKPMKSISWEGVDSHLCVTDLTHFEWFSQQKYIANMVS